MLAMLALVFVVPNVAQAVDILGWFLQMIAKFFELLTRLVGFILFLEVKGLIEVAQYSNFVSPGPTAVQVGWRVARDLSNMFFIIILLVIAFATIVGYEEYNLRRLLPRLLIMAVVINFSKTITGLVIDVGQVIMLTFVNGFKDAAGGNFLKAFQVDKLLRMSQRGDVSTGGLVVGMMLAFVMVSIAAAVVLIMLITLIFRFVYLWILVILSPIAFLASTIPPGRPVYDKWWGELKKYVIYGPIVAFFLWLALLTAQLSQGNIAQGEKIATLSSSSAAQQEISSAQTTGAGGSIPTEAANSDVFISMIVFTALLFGGLKVATEMGGVVSQKVGGFTTNKLLKGTLRAGFGAVPRMMGAGLRGGGNVIDKGRQRLARVPLAQNRLLRGAQKGVLGSMRAAAGLAKGAGTISSVQGRRLTGTGGIAKLKQAIGGSAEEVSAVSPGSLAQKAYHASGKEALETAKALQSNPAAMKEAINSGSLKELHRQLKFDGKKDAAATSAAGDLAKHIVDQLPEAEAKLAGRGISGSDAFKYVNPDNYAGYAPHLQKEAIAALGNADKPELRNAVAADLAQRQEAGTLDDYLAEKGMSLSDIPAGVLSGGAEQQTIARRIVEEAERDPELAKKVYSDPNKREGLAEAANERFQNANAGMQRGRAAMVAAATGGLSANDIASSSFIGKEAGHINFTDVQSAVKAASKSDEGVQRAVSAMLTSVVENGSEEVRRKILSSESMSDMVDPTVADDARQVSQRNVRSVTSDAASKIASLRASGDNNGADALQGAVDGLRQATRDLTKKESQIAAEKRRYRSAEKNQDSGAMNSSSIAMDKLAGELKQIRKAMKRQVGDVESKT